MRQHRCAHQQCDVNYFEIRREHSRRAPVAHSRTGVPRSHETAPPPADHRRALASCCRVLLSRGFLRRRRRGSGVCVCSCVFVRVCLSLHLGPATHTHSLSHTHSLTHPTRRDLGSEALRLLGPAARLLLAERALRVRGQGQHLRALLAVCGGCARLRELRGGGNAGCSGWGPSTLDGTPRPEP